MDLFSLLPTEIIHKILHSFNVYDINVYSRLRAVCIEWESLLPPIDDVFYHHFRLELQKQIIYATTRQYTQHMIKYMCSLPNNPFETALQQTFSQFEFEYIPEYNLLKKDLPKAYQIFENNSDNGVVLILYFLKKNFDADGLFINYYETDKTIAKYKRGFKYYNLVLPYQYLAHIPDKDGIGFAVISKKGDSIKLECDSLVEMPPLMIAKYHGPIETFNNVVSDSFKTYLSNSFFQ